MEFFKDKTGDEAEKKWSREYILTHSPFPDLSDKEWRDLLNSDEIKRRSEGYERWMEMKENGEFAKVQRDQEAVSILDGFQRERDDQDPDFKEQDKFQDEEEKRSLLKALGQMFGKIRHHERDLERHRDRDIE